MENINDNNDQDNSDSTDEVSYSTDEVSDSTDEVSDHTDEVADAPFTTTEANDGPQFAAGSPLPPPLPPQPGVSVEDRLVRDPHASFGGVLSGIANRYGWETSLTRLAFVVAILLSGGTAIVAYLLAWMIIPRARFWPPVVRKRTRSLSGRDLGLALIGVALLVVIAAGAGQAGAIIVPLVLVGGGVWMLLQNPREEVVAAGAEPIAGASTFEFASGAPSAPWTSPQMPTIAPQSVEPRKRGRKFVVAGLIAAILLTPILIIGGVIAAVAFGDIDIDVSETSTPVDVESIPSNRESGDGEYILDLRNVDFSEVDPSDPVEVSITQEFGRIEVRLDSEVPVEVFAEVDLGELDVLGQNEEGITNDVTVFDEDALLILDLGVDVGEIEVVRG